MSKSTPNRRNRWAVRLAGAIGLLLVVLLLVFMLILSGKEHGDSLIHARMAVEEAQAISASHILPGMSFDEAKRAAESVGWGISTTQPNDDGEMLSIMREEPHFSALVLHSLQLQVQFDSDSRVESVTCHHFYTWL